jgi:hypothetical protein
MPQECGTKDIVQNVPNLKDLRESQEGVCVLLESVVSQLRLAPYAGSSKQTLPSIITAANNMFVKWNVAIEQDFGGLEALFSLMGPNPVAAKKPDRVCSIVFALRETGGFLTSLDSVLHSDLDKDSAYHAAGACRHVLLAVGLHQQLSHDSASVDDLEKNEKIWEGLRMPTKQFKKLEAEEGRLFDVPGLAGSKGKRWPKDLWPDDLRPWIG